LVLAKRSEMRGCEYNTTAPPNSILGPSHTNKIER